MNSFCRLLLGACKPHVPQLHETIHDRFIPTVEDTPLPPKKKNKKTDWHTNRTSQIGSFSAKIDQVKLIFAEVKPLSFTVINVSLPAVI